MWRRLVAIGCAGWLGLGAALGLEQTVAGLSWDALEKSYAAEPGETQAEFMFQLTNSGEEELEIVSTSTSCSCSAAIMRQQPWKIGPGASDELKVVVDLRGRRGGLTKTVYVATNRGEQLLLVHVQIPPPPAVQRDMNMVIAQADRQAVLRGDCARCHVTPTEGKHGKELFETACQICHGAEHRASFVPDLMVAKGPRDAAYWQAWIRNGGEGTMMPAFAKERGGSLEEAQIESLVKYLTENLAREPAVSEGMETTTTDGH